MKEEDYVRKFVLPELRKLYPDAKIFIPDNNYYKNRRASKSHPDIVIEHSPKRRTVVEFKKELRPNYPSVCDITGKGIFGQLYTWIDFEERYNKTPMVGGMPILALLPYQSILRRQEKTYPKQ